MVKIDLNLIDPEQNYTIKEVSDMFKVSRSTIQVHIKRGNIKSRVIFGKIHIRGSVLLEYLNRT